MHFVQLVAEVHSKQPPLAEHEAHVAEDAALAACKKYFVEHAAHDISVVDDPPHLLHYAESYTLAPA